MPTHTHTQRVTVGDRTLTANKTITAASSVTIEEAVPGAAVDLPLVCAIDVSALKSIYVTSDKVITVFFSGPDLAVTLELGVPFVWHEASEFANPFGSDDVTGILLGGEGEEEAIVQIEILTDPTP